MLTNIAFLTGLIFASFYLTGFWLTGGESIETGFRKFNITFANLIGGLILMSVLFMDLPWIIKGSVLIWKCLLLSVSSFSWRKKKISPLRMTLPAIWGIMVIIFFLRTNIPVDWQTVTAVVLGGLILCISIFAMILGHWYLNVHGLSVDYLIKACYVFWALIVFRFFWDIYVILTQKVLINGEALALYNFMFHFEGFFLLVAIFFGVILPGIVMYFVLGTLKVKSTQSATGLLYVIVAAICMGDLSFKYCLLKFGLAL